MEAHPAIAGGRHTALESILSMEAYMNRIPLLVISLVVFVVGLLFLFSSIRWGTEAANAYLGSHGGSMDTTQFVIILQENIHIYQWIGAILSLLGGLGALQALQLRTKE